MEVGTSSRGFVHAEDTYSGFSVCSYTGDTSQHTDACAEELRRALGGRIVVMPRQVHGTEIAVLDNSEMLEARIADGAPCVMLGEADGVVTNLKGIAIGVNTADCVPVVIVDEAAGVVAAIHAGWRGAVAHIIGEGVKAMGSLGASPDRMKAYIAPCIHVCCFEVGEEVASQFPEDCVVRPSESAGDKTGSGIKPHVDLVKFVTKELNAAGIATDRITIHPDCTRCNPVRYFSARALGIASGRNFTFVILKNQE